MKSKIVLFDEDVLVAFKQKNVDFDEFSAQVNTNAQAKRQCELTPLYSVEKQIDGLCIYTQNEKASKNLSQQLLSGEMELNYYAVVVGEQTELKGTYSACVALDKQTGLYAHIPELNYDAINFAFEYEVKEKVDKISLIKIKGAVSDANLIRFALYDMGTPVFGDKDYKGDTLAKDTFMALTLAELRFVQPKDDAERTFIVVPESKPWSFFNLDKWFKI